MHVTAKGWAVAVGVAMMAAGCGSPPNDDIAAARAALQTATTERAGQYAGEPLKAAQDAQAALDAELKAQEDKWLKSYERTAALARTAKEAGDKAASDAVAAREKAEAAAAAKAKAEAAAREKAALAAKRAVRVGGQIRPPIKIKDVAPVYPAIARSARVTGAVTVEATIGEDGKVADARVVKSVPLLDQAALDAVRQWEYRPTLLNGVPVPVVVTVVINFKQP
jgi:TonB family protein